MGIWNKLFVLFTLHVVFTTVLFLFYSDFRNGMYLKLQSVRWMDLDGEMGEEEEEEDLGRFYVNKETGKTLLKDPIAPPGVTFTSDPIVITDYHTRDYELPCPVFNTYLGDNMPSEHWCILKNNIQKYKGSYFCFVSSRESFIVPFKQVINIKVDFVAMFRETGCTRYWDSVDEYEDSYQFMSHLSDFLRFYFALKLSAMYFDTDTIIIQDGFVGLENFLVKQGEKWMYSSPLRLSPAILLDAIRLQCKFYDPKVWGSVGPFVVTEVYKRHRHRITVLDKDQFQCEAFREQSFLKNLFDEQFVKYVLSTCKVFHFGYEILSWGLRKASLLAISYVYEFIGIDTLSPTPFEYCHKDLPLALYSGQFEKRGDDYEIIQRFLDINVSRV